LRNKGVGIKLGSYGLRAQQCSTLKTNLVELCRLEETSVLVRAQHLVQSPTELSYVRRPPAPADACLRALREVAGPGDITVDSTALERQIQGSKGHFLAASA